MGTKVLRQISPHNMYKIRHGEFQCKIVNI